jgi:hypothetical protein
MLLQRRYHLFLTPLGWAIDFRQEQLTIPSWDWLPQEMVGRVLHFLPLVERVQLQRLSSGMQRLSQLDPAVQRLLTLQPEAGIHQAIGRLISLEPLLHPAPEKWGNLPHPVPASPWFVYRQESARADWEELLLWHSRRPRPKIQWTTEEEKSLAVDIFCALCDQEDRHRTEGNVFYQLDWLLMASLEILRYLLRAYYTSTGDIATVAKEAIMNERVDVLQVVLEYFERKRPTKLDKVVVLATKKAVRHRELAILIWLLERYWHAKLLLMTVAITKAAQVGQWDITQYLLENYQVPRTFLASLLADTRGLGLDPQFRVIDLVVRLQPIDVLYTLEQYLLYAEYRDTSVLDKLRSYWSPGVSPSPGRVAEWRRMIVNQHQKTLVQWLDSQRW